MLHTPNIEMTGLSSAALEIPLVKGHTEGKKEDELNDIKKTILSAKEEYGIEAIGTGAIASHYQKGRIDSIGTECELTVISPLWGQDQSKYMQILISEGYRFIVTAVSCEGLGKEWIGREIAAPDLKELNRLSEKYKFNVAFEGGEAETLVLDCPLFKSKRIKILDADIVWNGYFGNLEIRKATLESKS